MTWLEKQTNGDKKMYLTFYKTPEITTSKRLKDDVTDKFVSVFVKYHGLDSLNIDRDKAKKIIKNYRETYDSEYIGDYLDFTLRNVSNGGYGLFVITDMEDNVYFLKIGTRNKEDMALSMEADNDYRNIYI